MYKNSNVVMHQKYVSQILLADAITEFEKGRSFAAPCYSDDDSLKDFIKYLNVSLETGIDKSLGMYNRQRF